MEPLGKIYKEAEATGDFVRIPAGGYICRITAVENVADKKYLWVIYDVATGEFKGLYSDEWSKDHPYAHRFVKSYKQTGDADKDKKIMGAFKAFLRAVDESNNTNFEGEAETGMNEKELVGKLIGLVIGYEEYETDRGEIRERTNVAQIKTVDAIKDGKFKVPELKKLKAKDGTTAPVQGFAPLNDEDIPF